MAQTTLVDSALLLMANVHGFIVGGLLRFEAAFGATICLLSRFLDPSMRGHEQKRIDGIGSEPELCLRRVRECGVHV